SPGLSLCSNFASRTVPKLEFAFASEPAFAGVVGELEMEATGPVKSSNSLQKSRHRRQVHLECQISSWRNLRSCHPELHDKRQVFSNEAIAGANQGELAKSVWASLAQLRRQTTTGARSQNHEQVVNVPLLFSRLPLTIGMQGALAQGFGHFAFASRILKGLEQPSPFTLPSLQLLLQRLCVVAKRVAIFTQELHFNGGGARQESAFLLGKSPINSASGLLDLMCHLGEFVIGYLQKQFLLPLQTFLESQQNFQWKTECHRQAFICRIALKVSDIGAISSERC